MLFQITYYFHALLAPRFPETVACYRDEQMSHRAWQGHTCWMPSPPLRLPCTPRCLHHASSHSPWSCSGKSLSQPFFWSWRLFPVGSFPGWPLPLCKGSFPHPATYFHRTPLPRATAAPQNTQLGCKSPSPEVTGYICTHSLKPRECDVDISILIELPEIWLGLAAPLSGHHSLLPGDCWWGLWPIPV